MSSENEENIEDNIGVSKIESKSTTDPKKKKWKKIAKNANKKTKRTKSRVSNAVERSFNQDLENDETHNTSISVINLYLIIQSEGNLDSFAMLILTINLVVGKGTKSITLLMSNSSKMEIVVEKAITEFNSLFSKEKVLFRLKNEPEKFGLKPSKKTGYPKTDMPSFNPKTTLTDSNLTTFTLIWKEEPYNFNKYFEKIKIKQKKICDKGCYVI